MNKKYIFVAIIFIILLAIFFYPKPMTKASGFYIEKFKNICYGFFIESYEIRPADFGETGFCFGIIKQKINPSYLYSIKYITLTEVDSSNLPEGLYIEKNQSNVSLLYNKTDDPLYLISPIRYHADDYIMNEIPKGYVTSYKLTKESLFFRPDFKYFLTNEKTFFHSKTPDWNNYKRNYLNINYETGDMLIPTDDVNIKNMLIFYKNNIISIPIKYKKILNPDYETIVNSIKNKKYK